MKLINKMIWFSMLILFFLLLANSATVQEDSAKAKIKSANITAKIVKITLSPESIMYVRVFIQFTNHSNKICKLKSYRVSWKNNSKNIVLKGVSLNPKQIIIRHVKIYSRIEKKADLKVFVVSECQ